MGYAGRMLAQHNPWLYFGLWVVMIGLLNVSVICGVLQGHVSLWIGIPCLLAVVICSVVILASFFVSAKQQSNINKHKVELVLSKAEEKLPYSDELVISVLIAIAVLFSLGVLFLSGLKY